MEEFKVGDYTVRIEESKPPGAVLLTIANESLGSEAHGIFRESHRRNGLEIAFLRGEVMPFSGGNTQEQYAGFKLPDNKTGRKLVAQYMKEDADEQKASAQRDGHMCVTCAFDPETCDGPNHYGEYRVDDNDNVFKCGQYVAEIVQEDEEGDEGA